jgi:hydrogenase expression/formation protein HypD
LGFTAIAQAVIADVFEPSDENWRGIGIIPGSGLAIRAKYAQHDAARIFAAVPVPPSREPAGCRCGEILRGVLTPPQCPLFRKVCTPATPVGACMVSSEGTCAAYYRYAAEA